MQIRARSSLDYRRSWRSSSAKLERGPNAQVISLQSLMTLTQEKIQNLSAQVTRPNPHEPLPGARSPPLGSAPAPAASASALQRQRPNPKSKAKAKNCAVIKLIACN